MVRYTYGQEVIVVGNTLVKHGFRNGQKCKIEKVWANDHKGYPAYEMYYMTKDGKHNQIVSAADIVPVDVDSNEIALGFLEAKSPW